MSKIFEGLQRAGTDRASSIIERISRERAQAPPAGRDRSAPPPDCPGVVTQAADAPPLKGPSAPPAACRPDRPQAAQGPGDNRRGAAPPSRAVGGVTPGQRGEDLSLRFSRTATAQLAAGPLALVAGTDARVSEQYRIIRTKIVQHPAAPRRIVVSSAGSGDGKTVTSGNLAWTLALRSGAPVLLVDADFRHSSIAGLYGIPGEPGLADVLAGSCTLEEAIVRIEQVPNLYVLPGGSARSNPAELLDSPCWKSLASDFGEWFRFTVFDAPPSGAVADYDLIQAVSDGVILVVRPDHSERRSCLRALEATPRERLLGVVLNHVEDWFLWKSPNAYYYYAGKRKH